MPPSIPRWPRVLLAVLALAGIGGIGTGCHEPPAQAPPELRVFRRLLDDPPRAAATPSTHSGYESLNDVRKLVVAAATSVDPSTVCTPTSSSTSPTRPCSVTVPRSLLPAQTLIVETAPLPLLRAATRSPAVRERLHGSLDLRRRRHFVLRRRKLDAVPTVRNLPIWMTPWIRGWPVLGVGAWDFVSRPIEVPEGAVLTFAVGVQEPAWYVDSAPVQFTVEARSAAGDVEVYRRSLDPARRRDDRRWFDERVPLTAFAGRTAVLHFKVRPLSAGELRPQLPMWADPTVLAPVTERARPMPSIVLVSLDTLRAKSMSAYGYARETTPFLTRFAATGVRFANAYTTFSNTFGAHMSMLTGAYPSKHAVRTSRTLSPDIPTLAERLRRAGYDTAAFTEDALLDASAGFQRGFAHYWENKSIDVGAGDAPGTFRRALTWLAAHRDRPFFLFVHTYAVHSPYRPSPPYDRLFVEPGQSRNPSNQLLYEQEIRQLDDDVARLVAGLDALVPRDQFVLVITADHGEEFGEHGAALHTQLYDEILHVPLFVRWPGTVPAGRTLEHEVSLVDVAPTLLDLVGLDPTVESGMSLRPLLGGDTTTLARSVVFAESPPSIWSRYAWSYVARRPAGKCFSFDNPALDRCFDLAGDPGELAPLPPVGGQAALWEAARTYGESAFTGEAPSTPPPPSSQHDDPERVEKLRALGYLQ